jgi:hypothetical protein
MLLRKIRLSILPDASGFEPRQWVVSDFETTQWDLSGFETKLEILNEITWDLLGFGNKKPCLVLERNSFDQKIPISQF